MAGLALKQPPEEEAEPQAAPANDQGKPKGMDDTAILAMLEGEKTASIGFENGTELEKKRTQALNYSKGEMSADMPSLPNRSKAVSTDVEDAIQTVLPDLMDIFTGGEDVAAFAPLGPDDEERAQQETDWVNYVAFQKLKGFLLLNTAIKDALQVDTGVIKTWWVDNETTEDEEVKGKSAVEIQMAVQSGAEIVSIKPAGFASMAESEQSEAGEPGEAGEQGETPQTEEPGEQPEAGEDGQAGLPLFNATLRKSYDKGCIKSAAIDPQNISVAQDATLDLSECVYIVIRSYPRAQALLDQGFEASKVEQLGAISSRSANDQTDMARDVAGESTSQSQASAGTAGPEGADGKSLQRTVEVHEHFIRADIEGTGKSQLWQIQTDAACKVILHKKKIDRHGISVGTPFIVAHRFYGMSIAEKLVEIQKIKTALWRLLLDSGYFALNQRTEVAMDKANDDTINDLMRNEPLVPVRSKTGDAVRPLQAGQLGFNAEMAIELASVMGEQRSGIVRNAQGINPDTLHDTAKGAQALMTMAQKRVRMIARVLAETLVKGWFLDIHWLSRKHDTRQEKTNLRGKWVDVDPSSFGDRADMVVEVGVGAGGKEMELALMMQVMGLQEKMIASQDPEYKKMASPDKVWNAVARFCSRGGIKAPENFFGNPEKIKAEEDKAKAERAAQGIPEPEPPPPPELMKIQGELQLQAKKHQDTMQLEGQKAQAKFASDQQASAMDAQRQQEQAAADAQMKREQMALDQQNKREQMALDAQLKRDQMAGDMQLKREQIAAEIELKRQQLNAELAMNHEIEMAKIKAGVYTKMNANGASTSEVHPGGEAGA